MPATARSKLCSSASAWLDVFSGIALSSALGVLDIVKYIYTYIYMIAWMHICDR